MRKIQEECGVFGIFSPETADLAPDVYYGLFALQHRGQSGCGMVINDDGVYTKMTAEGVEYELVEGEFKKAAAEVVTIGGKAMAYTDDVAVYVIGTDGSITKASITKNYSNGTDYNINVMYTANKDGQVDSIYILKVTPEL